MRTMGRHRKVDVREAREMLRNGASYQEIADRYGVSVGHIRMAFPEQSVVGNKKIVYRNLAEWMRRWNLSLTEFCRAIGYKKPQYEIFYGLRDIPEERIGRILDLTGMTREEALKR